MTPETSMVTEGPCDEKSVHFSGDKLTYIDGNGEEHTYTVAKEVKVTCDGKEAKLTDLESGDTIRMTISKDDKTKLLAVDSGKHIPSLSQPKASTTGK